VWCNIECRIFNWGVFGHNVLVIYFDEPLESLEKNADPKDPDLAKSLASSLFNAHQQAAKLIAAE